MFVKGLRENHGIFFDYSVSPSSPRKIEKYTSLSDALKSVKNGGKTVDSIEKRSKPLSFISASLGNNFSSFKPLKVPVVGP